MNRRIFSSLTDQVTDLLRQGMMEGRWRDTLPGRDRLADELGCSHWTVEEAMQRLVKEGLLASQGAGRRRRIELPEKNAPVTLRVLILLYEDADAGDRFVAELRLQLQRAGYTAQFAARSLISLDMDVKRVARFVRKNPADAWVVCAGSRAVLEWFADRPEPAFAIFGRQTGVDIAGVASLKSPAMAEVLERLVAQGHRRIVMMVSEAGRKPHPGLFERRFLQKLEALGIAPGSYHLPDWGHTREGFHARLALLFRHTPPTVLILDDPALFFAAQQFLNRRGLAVPDDVSMIALDDHPAFAWFEPEVTHLRSDSRKWVRRAVRWVDNVARGKDDRRKTITKAEFIEGGTIGPAPKERP